MTANNGKLLEFFLRLLKLNMDGTNWIVFQDRFIFAADAAGLVRHIDGSAKAPTVLVIATSTMSPTTDKKAALEKNQVDLKEWAQGEAVVKQGIAGAIPNNLFVAARQTHGRFCCINVSKGKSEGSEGGEFTGCCVGDASTRVVGSDLGCGGQISS
jgi:hypothetical protein